MHPNFCHAPCKKAGTWSILTRLRYYSNSRDRWMIHGHIIFAFFLRPYTAYVHSTWMHSCMRSAFFFVRNINKLPHLPEAKKVKGLVGN